MKQALALHQNLQVALLEYLSTQPYKNVARLINELQALPVVNLTENATQGTEPAPEGN